MQKVLQQINEVRDEVEADIEEFEEEERGTRDKGKG